MDKMGHIHAMEYNLALSRNKVVAPDTTQISLEDLVLDEIKQVLCGPSYWKYLEQANS